MLLLVKAKDWALSHRDRILMGFIALNFLGIAADCTLAHWSAGFYHWGMWVSLVLPLLAAVPTVLYTFRKAGRVGKILLTSVAWVSIVVGFLGTAWHLLGQFFLAPSLQSLIHSAPILGPVVITGLGVLLLVALDPPQRGIYRSLALVGALGFFSLALMCLQDHAMNSFYMWSEWVPIIMGTFAGLIFAWRGFRRFESSFPRGLLLSIAGASMLVGLAGTFFHLRGFLAEVTIPMLERFHLSALFAPLLFCDAALFAFIADLWSPAWVVQTEKTA